MTPKKIYFERPDIKEKVMMEYPIVKREKNCKIEKAKREAMRWERAKRLYGETINANPEYMVMQ
jgi:hypothetical protein